MLFCLFALFIPINLNNLEKRDLFSKLTCLILGIYQNVYSLLSYNFDIINDI